VALAIAILVAISVGVSLVVFRLTKQMIVGVPASAFVSAAFFQFAAGMQLGHMDPFWPIAFIVSLLPCAIVAAAVGYLIRRRSRIADK
jgi:hypothetical protein